LIGNIFSQLTSKTLNPQNPNSHTMQAHYFVLFFVWLFWDKHFAIQKIPWTLLNSAFN